MTLLKSLPGLANVVVLLCFVFTIFGILSLKVWGGLLHSRCRMTPFPVKLDIEEFRNQTLSSQYWPDGFTNETIAELDDWELFPYYEEAVIANADSFRCLAAANNDATKQQDT